MDRLFNFLLFFFTPNNQLLVKSFIFISLLRFRWSRLLFIWTRFFFIFFLMFVFFSFFCFIVCNWAPNRYIFFNWICIVLCAHKQKCKRKLLFFLFSSRKCKWEKEFLEIAFTLWRLYFIHTIQLMTLWKSVFIMCSTHTHRIWNIYFKSSHTLLVHGLSNWYQRRNKKQNWKRRTVRYLYRLYVSPWITLTVILFVWNDSHLRQTISSVSSFYRQNKWGRKVKLIWYPNDIHTFFSRFFVFVSFFGWNG